MVNNYNFKESKIESSLAEYKTNMTTYKSLSKKILILKKILYIDGETNVIFFLSKGNNLSMIHDNYLTAFTVLRKIIDLFLTQYELKENAYNIMISILDESYNVHKEMINCYRKSLEFKIDEETRYGNERLEDFYYNLKLLDEIDDIYEKVTKNLKTYCYYKLKM